MQFEKKLVYLGDRISTFDDGKQMHTLSFFDVDGQDSIDMNVMASNDVVMSGLKGMSFGCPCLATIALRDTDKKRVYKLALVGLSPVKS